jgi:hypothetical protein
MVMLMYRLKQRINKRKMSKELTVDESLLLAKDETTSLSELKELSKNTNAEIREAVAGNESVSQEILHELRKDSDDYVRAAVGGNVRTSPSDLSALGHDASLDVLEAVAGNDRTPVVILEALEKHEDSYIHEAAKETLLSIQEQEDWDRAVRARRARALSDEPKYY